LVQLIDLWMPIVLSTVAVFFISFLMWMVFPHHRKDWARTTDEDGLIKTLGDQKLKPGQYNFPHCGDPSAMKDPVWMEKYSKGPKGFLVLMPDGPPNIPQSMIKSTIYNLLVTICVAYVATIGLTVGDPDVFRMTATVAFLSFGAALGWGPIWFGRSIRSTMMELFDALVYGLVTGAIFMWLWPSGDVPMP
tara:strand:- start:9048 stop:9620 length:573 start_codon:yes stop_codon:yes gene_type:complete